MSRLVELIYIAMIAFAPVTENNPVQWSYAAKKIAPNTYELHMFATIQQGWHLYSQTQPDLAIAMPTSIKFIANPLISLTGKPREVGNMKKYKDRTLGIEGWQYAGKVDFVQIIKVKGNFKTNISGTVEFQVCTDDKCLPPKEISFNVMLK
jgi:thiol:disulfide interchange protein DsbD